MIQKRTPADIFDMIEKSRNGGADALGIQFCILDAQYRNADVYKSIFEKAGELPTYVTNYRHCTNEGKSDETLAEELLELIHCGGTMADVMGDMFCRHPEELTDDPEAVKKQIELIDKIHAAGGEVLMSSHVLKYTPAERVIEIALAQQERGADFVKIVTSADDDIQQCENLKMIPMLKKELKVPFLYLCGGNCKILRRMGPILGCGMWLCVYEHHELSTKSQPILANVKAIYENYNEPPYISPENK